MILEKIKQHVGKLSFFVISVLLVAVSALYLNQSNQLTLSNTAKESGVGSAAANSKTKAATAKKAPSATTKVS